MSSFEDLEVWKKCREFRKDVSEHIRQFPKNEEFRLVDQLKRVSRSLTANIAEGHGRFHYVDNVKCCRNSRGSLNEVLDHLICAYDERLITGDDLNKLREKYNECFRLLNGYISYLKSKQQTS
jgi:four helix bundle protein